MTRRSLFTVRAFAAAVALLVLTLGAFVQYDRAAGRGRRLHDRAGYLAKKAGRLRGIATNLRRTLDVEFGSAVGEGRQYQRADLEERIKRLDTLIRRLEDLSRDYAAAADRPWAASPESDVFTTLTDQANEWISWDTPTTY